MTSNTRTNVYFYTKFGTTRKVIFPRNPSTTDRGVTPTRCRDELAAAQSCPFTSTTGDLTTPVTSMQISAERILYLSCLINMLNDLRYLGASEAMIDQHALDSFGLQLNVENPKEALLARGIFLKDGEVHVVYQGQ